MINSIFAIHLPDIIDSHPEIRVVAADMSYGARLERFKAFCPEKFINVGIAEQNMIGVCAGLAEEGLKPVAIAQAAFITMRDFEPVRQYMSYMGYPIILVGLNAGFGMQFMGNTHYAMEDISIMRSIPGIDVLSPADPEEAVKAFDYALSSGHPTYLRLTGSPAEDVYPEDFDYRPGRANVLREGADITIFATGAMVARALKAAELISGSTDASVGVIDIHSLSPLDSAAILGSRGSSLIVTVEEHYVSGGLGSAVADFISGESGFPPLLKLGIRDRYSTVGNYEFLLQQHRLTPEMIAEDIIGKYNAL